MAKRRASYDWPGGTCRSYVQKTDGVQFKSTSRIGDLISVELVNVNKGSGG